MQKKWPLALAGSASVGASLGVAELAAGLVSTVPSLVESIGGVVIDNVPTAVKDFAIATFGTNDKTVLVVGITVVALVLGGVIGIVAGQRWWAAVVVFTGFGVLGAAAAVSRRESVAGSVVAAAVVAAAGSISLRCLHRRAGVSGEGVGPPPDPTRRAFVASVGAVLGLAALSAGAGRALWERGRRAVAGREEVVLPIPAEVPAAPPSGSSLAVTDLTDLITPNDRFYKIDTSLSTPQVDLETWTVAVTGMVERPYEMSFGELLDMDLVERYITLTCVSNEVGGSLIGNAKWLGVPLADVLTRARVAEGADQVVGRSVDGFTVGFPTSAVFDGREALLAVGMNDEALPFDHGFPARLVVAGLYGYVSATKWLAEIELTTWDAFDAYWVPRGWSKEGPIKTQSRIDTPRDGAVVGSEPRTVAGMAWAPNRGIAAVEVELDGVWVEAELAESLDDDCWRQWRVEWVPTPGSHRIRVRATDADGETQTSDLARPAPDGATGWHTVGVTVEA
ncbi:sulfite oxidase [soil metagenome]